MEELKRPTNTTEETNRNPLAFLAEAMIGGTSNAIEQQEARGQREFVGSDTLPTKIDPKDIKTLEDAGFKFLGPVEGDDMFQYVEMAPGWKKVPTDHSMWSDLVDDKGRRRGGIFYKAAFYDRSSHMHLSVRYGVALDYDLRDKEGVAVAYVKDGDTVIHTTEPVTLPSKESGYDFYRESDKATEAAAAWLKSNYPDCEKTSAYWD